MNIEININCETEREFLSHLSDIRRQFNREVKRQNGEILVPCTLENSGCFGDHTVNIIPECNRASREDKDHFPDGSGLCLSCGKQLGVEITIK